jgi:uncharacterized membrane protein HdeD (DUF308 family)
MEISVDRSIRHWWVFVLRGILFILLGIYMFSSPGSGYLALGFVFGLVILMAGIAELLHAYQDRGRANRGWHLFIGIIDLVLGLVLMNHLAASMTILRIIVGIYFLFKGISILVIGRVGSSWWITLGGLVVLLFAALILFNPVFGAVTIVIWTALAFVITGIFNIMLGIRMKPLS